MKLLNKTIAVASLALLLLNSSCAPLGGIIVANPSPERGPEKRPDRGQGPYPSYRTLNIPNGHLPPPGECRVWYPGKPPGQQPPPVSCSQALRDYRSGTWIITRTDNKTLEVKERKNNAMEAAYYLVD